MRKLFSVTPVCALVATIALAPGCSPTDAAVGVPLGTAAASAYMAQVPTNEITQTYYLGVFDPQDQLPPTVYRVTVRGQSSAFSNTSFASGWVPAQFIDALQTKVAFNADSGLPGVEGQPLDQSIAGDRRLVLFGPEGFREAPKDYRLVITMEANSQSYFGAIDEALGEIAEVQLAAADDDVARHIRGLRSMMAADSQRITQTSLDLLDASGGAR